MRNPNLTFIREAINATGGTAPREFDDMVTDINTINAAASQYRPTNSGYAALAEVWADAILDGRDPGTDPKIINVLVGNALADGDIEYAAQNVVEKRFSDKLPRVQSKILSSFAKAVAEAGQVMTEAHSILGQTSIDDVHTVNSMGPTALQASIDAREANTKVRTIVSGWRGLASITHFAPAPELPTILADLDIATWEQVRRVKDPWVLIQHGATLDLAITAEEVERRTARLDTEREARSLSQDALDRRSRGRDISFR